MNQDKSSAGPRVLVVADQVLAGDSVRKSLTRELGTEPGEVFVVAPALAKSGLHHQMGDVDEARDEARERLDQSLAALKEAGLNASGEVGDSDPLIAISDEMLKQKPDRIFIVANTGDHEEYAEQDLLERAERDFDQPVTRLMVDGAGDGQKVVDVASSESGAGRDKGPQSDSGNMPPLTKRNILGIVFAIIGTLILGALATAAAGDDKSPVLEEGYLDGTAPAIILIALFVALINLAHIVGLFFFQSVRYTGPFERFFSRMSLFGTAAAIVVCLILYALN